MTTESLLQELAKTDGFSVADQTATFEDIPFLVSLRDGKLLTVAKLKPKGPLLLSPESDYTRSADRLGLSQESKVGQADFDDAFVIRDPDNRADELLSTEVRALVLALGSFFELEFTNKEYRLLKQAPATASEVVDDILLLAGLVRLTS